MLSLRALWVTWALWIASFTILYALPALAIAAGVAARSPDLILSAAGPLSEPWTWDTELWFPSTLALVVPTVFFRIVGRRSASVFLVEPDSDAIVLDYRSPRPWVVVTSPRAVRRRISAYWASIALAMGLSAVPFLVLIQTWFRVPFGCLSVPYIRSPAEHLAFVTMLLAVAVFHAPLGRRVLGAPPSLKLA